MSKFLLLLSLASLTLLAAGCATSPTATPRPAPTAAPSVTPPPTETPLPPTPTPVPPTDTPEPPTSTPLPPIATTKIIVNVHAGPGVGYPTVGKLQKGAQSPIIGKSADSMWWQIQFGAAPAWIPADFTDVQGGTNEVLVISVAPLPTPTALTLPASAFRSPTPSATPTIQVPPPGGRIYFVVHPSGTYNTAWVRPTNKQQIFSDVPLGPSPGDMNPNAAFGLSTNASPLDWSEAAGKLAFVFGSGTQDKLQTVDQYANTATLDSHGAIVTPRWFGDGQRLAFVGYDNTFRNQAIYVINADGSGKQVCFGARSGETLRGLAVSKRTGDIAFVSNVSGSFEIWKMDRSCGGATQLTHDNADDSAPAFSPDGSKIAYVSNKTGPTDYEIYVIPATGGAAEQLGPGFTPAFSPDGFWLTFSQNAEVYIMDVTGGNIQTLTPGDHPTWAP